MCAIYVPGTMYAQVSVSARGPAATTSLGDGADRARMTAESVRVGSGRTLFSGKGAIGTCQGQSRTVADAWPTVYSTSVGVGAHVTLAG